MKKVLTVLVVLGVGVALDRLFDGTPPRAEAGGGGPLPPCQDINGDGSSDVSDAISFLNWLFLGGSAPTCQATNGEPAGLPNTSQTLCYDQNGNVVDCTSDVCGGQDGSYATGCPPQSRCTEPGDGTGLMWQKETGNEGNPLTWCDALAYCEGLTFAGQDDWRLPNVRDLQSIVDYGRHTPAISTVFGTLSSGYWSSTSVASAPGSAWIVGFGNGFVNSIVKGDSRHVRAVRSGS